MQRFNHQRRIDVLPFQTPELLAQVNLSEAECRAALQFVDVMGKHYRAAAAANAAMAHLGGAFKFVALFYHVPLIAALEERVYAWVARNRYRLPGSAAACAIPQNKNDK